VWARTFSLHAGRRDLSHRATLRARKLAARAPRIAT
jgi:hypothetical protein